MQESCQFEIIVPEGICEHLQEKVQSFRDKSSGLICVFGDFPNSGVRSEARSPASSSACHRRAPPNVPLPPVPGRNIAPSVPIERDLRRQSRHLVDGCALSGLRSQPLTCVQAESAQRSASATGKSLHAFRIDLISSMSHTSSRIAAIGNFAAHRGGMEACQPGLIARTEASNGGSWVYIVRMPNWKSWPWWGAARFLRQI